MTKAMAKQKSSKQTDTHKAEFQKMVEGSKEKTVGALKENALNMYERPMIFIGCATY